VRQAETGTVGLEPPFHDSLLLAPRTAGPRSGAGRRYRGHYLLVGLGDTLALAVALLVGYQLRFGRLLPPWRSGCCSAPSRSSPRPSS
jgi:hypothetical protein